MQELYKSDYKESSSAVYVGFIAKDVDESIEDAVWSYSEGEYSKTLEVAKAEAASDTSRPSPEFYHVCVTYVDGEITSIMGDRFE